MKRQICAIVRFTSFEDEFKFHLIEDLQKVADWLKKDSSMYGNITGHRTQGGKMIADGWRKSEDKEVFRRYKPNQNDFKVPEDIIKYNKMN
ncbi:hypothetical protein O181_100985 [Austropuccinia psidii MF-1]|uniref:Tet-like 2OG-Fe(II) oxygenase domain-containing protein n=1 Tax=Austropuccinia psidii MF-1 TaxID=1389203 RepID=A0A9Q3JDN1_9BASI|nr:hypothetical protein [Austropuccinia psidii MF-1]